MKEVVLEKEGIMGQFAALVMKHEEQAGYSNDHLSRF